MATAPTRRLPRDPSAEFRPCPHCGGLIPKLHKRCRRRTCPGYARIWAGDQRQKLFANLNAYADQVPSGVRSPRVLVTAVTAPGVDSGIGWDERKCRDLRPHTHSGRLGCRALPHVAARWNTSAAERWRNMHRDAYQRCRREGLRPWMLVRVWEMQKRGLLHAHPVLAYSTLGERAGADRYIEHLDDLRHRWGFGYIERKRRVREPRAAAAYLSSYFINGKGQKASLEESVRSDAMPRSIIHVSVALSQASGVTMRNLRLKRYLWVRVGPLLDMLRGELGLKIDDLYRAHLASVSMIQLAICGWGCRAP